MQIITEAEEILNNHGWKADKKTPPICEVLTLQ